MKSFFEKWKIEILFISSTLFILVFGFLSGFVLFQLGIINLPKTSRAIDRHEPVVMILPHQDDEMFMIGKFLSFVEQGHPAFVAMATDGAGSHIRTDLQKQGYINLDRQGFAHARNLEFLDSMQRLGISKDHILFMDPGGVDGSTNPIYQDGTLTELQAKEIIQKLYEIIGDGIYLTVAGGHSDHVVIEHALKKFSGIRQKLFFPLGKSPDTELFFLTDSEQKQKQEALRAYSLWKPEENRFAIGGHSVDLLISKWASSTTEYYFEGK